MDLEFVTQSEVSEKEETKYCILTHICEIQENGTNESILGAGIEMQTQRTDTWSWRAEEEGETNWEISIDTYRPP